MVFALKTAVITGITGQDGAYLASHLLEEGYKVIGVSRPISNPSTENLERLKIANDVLIETLDLTDKGSIERVLVNHQPEKFFNLAAQSFVSASFQCPAVTAEINSMGVVRILETIRNFSCRTKFYQASTSEMFGKVQEVPQNESTPFYPRSPYGVSKLFSHWMTINYRESYSLYAVSGILFNHESPLRGKQFVTRKIVLHLAKLSLGLIDAPLRLGNLEARRDWGHAKDYVKGMNLMLEQSSPQDFVLASGKTHSIREFVQMVSDELGLFIIWEGNALDEKGINSKTGKLLVEIDKSFYRPCEVDMLIGDPSKAERILGWKRQFDLSALINDMVESEINLLTS